MGYLGRASVMPSTLSIRSLCVSESAFILSNGSPKSSLGIRKFYRLLYFLPAALNTETKTGVGSQSGSYGLQDGLKVGGNQKSS
jgi:hypothetical protein